MEQILMQAIGGIAGGAAGSKVSPGNSLGGIGNLIAGAAGGIGGGSLLSGVLGLGGAEGIAAIAGNLAGGGVSGLIVQIVVGMIIKKFRG